MLSERPTTNQKETEQNKAGNAAKTDGVSSANSKNQRQGKTLSAASMETQEPASLPKQKSESLTHSWNKTKLNMYFLGEKTTTLLWRLKICQGMSLPEGKPAGQHIKLASSF